MVLASGRASGFSSKTGVGCHVFRRSGGVVNLVGWLVNQRKRQRADQNPKAGDGYDLGHEACSGLQDQVRTECLTDRDAKPGGLNRPGYQIRVLSAEVQDGLANRCTECPCPIAPWGAMSP